ncbi:uncharacterized protein LOC110692316 [Chenopodium quinoa]|uniref:uncharacterized protein LOC110692316 n=1 Tax=Chenopodium quinoa TaxID=63459 RepID=UPI000B782B0E|nr:uncharacterized protein LOC110692316 [Chenopodium quinoa]
MCLSLSPMENTTYLETVRAILTFAMPPVRLQYLRFDGHLCKFLAAGCFKKLTQTFSHLRILCLTKLDLDDFNVFCFTINMVQNCPYIKYLELSSITPNKSVLQHKFDYDNNFKLRHLLKAKITGITGSSAELKLVEYIVGISVKLTRFLFKCNNLDPSSELKVLRELLQLPRASKKAKLVCLAQ